MKILDKLFFGLLFGVVLPVALFLVGWWGSIGRVAEDRIFIFAFTGLAIGIILDFFLLRKALTNLYEISTSNLVLIYIFYSVCCFGFFMGVPAFNVLLGIPAGYYAAMKCIILRKETVFIEHYFRQAAIFTSVIIFLVSIASATIALSDPFTAQNIKGMLGLNFEITKIILLIFIVLGGTVLIVFQYFLTKYTAKLSYKFFNREITE